MRHRLVPLGAAAVLVSGACTTGPDTHVEPAPWIPASAQLASYDSCDKALEGIQRSVLGTLTEMRRSRDFRGGGLEVEEEALAAEAGDADSAGRSTSGDDGTAPAHSETNNAVSGVDEPDIVKTDGEYIYSVVESVLRVVDAGSGEIVAERDYDWEAWNHQLFLGDDELLVMYSRDRERDDRYYSEFTIDRVDPLTLEVLDTFTSDTGEGTMLDARMVDGEVRLALSSTPDVQPLWEEFYGNGDVADLRAAVRSTEIADWLPTFSVNGQEQDTDCRDIAHPDRFEGGQTVSVLSLPVDGSWSDVDPLTVMADGGTVHGTSESLYLAHNDYHWDESDPEAETELYRFVFDSSKPRLAGEAAVAGTLLNQYSLSEYDGHLRVATTENSETWWGIAEDSRSAEEPEPSKSTVTVLEIGDSALTEVGSVSDLGVDERIYAVRFIGATGYVVTFRQTDPLYTLDLADPANPVVTGELKITGYSAYLHPVGEDRLLGVGQEATEEGRTTGLQVSLFDVGGAEASVLDQYERLNAASAAEWDPHGFLYWQPEGIVVLPVWDWMEDHGDNGAVVLEIGDDSVTELAWIAHETGDGEEYYHTGITRSLVIGDRLWTLSSMGLMASEIDGGFDTAEWIDW